MSSIAMHPRQRPTTGARVLAAFAAAVTLASAADASAQSLVLSRLTGSFQDITSLSGLSSSGSNTSNCDDCSVTVTIPFTFRFDGRSITSAAVNSNGMLVFNGTSSDYTNDDIPSSNTPNGYIAPWWDDLYKTAVRWGTQGTAPNRVTIIQLEGYDLSLSSASHVLQWRLYESPSGQFDVWYGPIGTGYSGRTVDATVGWEGFSGTSDGSLKVETCTPSCRSTDLSSLSGTGWRGSVPVDPELIVTSVDSNFPRGALPGGTTTGSYTILNEGINTATNVVSSFYLSADTTLDPTVDTPIGTSTIASAPNGNTTGTVSVTVPASMAAGDYYLLVEVDSNQQYTEIDETNNVFEGPRFATAYELAGSDCVVTNAQGVNPGETLNFTLSLVNNGVPYVGSFDVRLRASTDASFDTTDPILGTVSMSFSGSNTEVGMGSFTLPTGSLSPGLYYPICEVDSSNTVTETSEANNIVVGATQFGSGPDFAVASVTMPTSVPPGNAVNVVTTITNSAVPYTGNVSYRLWASLDATLDSADSPLGNYTATFAGEASISDTESVTFPTSLAGGRYYVIAELDYAGAIAEVSETNNSSASAMDIANAIDFIANSATLTVASTVQAGDTVRVAGTASSTGLPFVGNVPVGVYFSSNDSYDATDVAGYTGLIFFPGATSGSIDVTFTVPNSLAPGAYSILFVVNPNNTPAEADTTNNYVVAGGASRTTTVQGADLRADSVTTDTNPIFIGRTMEVTTVIINESSTADARNFKYSLRLSENEIIRVTDPEIFLSASATIAAGQTATFTDIVQVPTFTSTVTRYLGVIVDIESNVPETSETNNIRRMATPLSVVFPIPDLTAQIVETATAAAAGEQIAVTRLISNSGVADSGTFEYQYYLSNNPTISTDDIALGRPQTLSLPYGQDDYGIDAVSIPADTSAGTYYVGVIVDPTDTVLEVLETNNSAVGPSIPVYGASITFITESLDGATLGVPYEVGLYAQGGAQPITWSVTAGSLPNGLTLDPQGLITGTPTREGLFEFTLRASSGTAYSDLPVSIRVTSPTVPLTVAVRLLRTGYLDRTYTDDLVAVGGVPPYKWSIADMSSLPSGLTLSEDGTISGTPAAASQFTFVVVVEDDVGARASEQLTLRVVSPSSSVQIQPRTLRDALVNEDYCTETNQVTFTAINGVAPYTWTLVSGNLPAGMTFSNTGELCGTPTMAGTFDFTIQAQDSTGVYDTSLFRIVVEGSDQCRVATQFLPTGMVNTPYLDENGDAVKLIASGCTDPLMWSAVMGTGDLPAGLSVAGDGTVSGTPTESGAFAFIANVTDSAGSLDLQPLSVTIEAEPVVDDGDDGGCTCATPIEGERGPAAWALMLLPGAALVFRRRRRA